MNEPKTRADLEDLGVRARRGLLTETERRLFEQGLARDPGSLLTHELGCDFDRVAAVRPGDDELIARVVAAVVRAPRRVPGRRSRFRWGFALAATLAAASAGAAWWSVRGSSLEGSSQASRRASPTAAAHAPTPPKPAAPATSATPFPEAAAPSPSAVTVDNHLKPSDAAQPDNARSLFRDASSARKDGDFGRAMRLYAELQRRFPSSAEAKLSHVSMGKLLLSVGKFADAERKFSDYLAAGGGPLSEEAWVGEAQSFRGQGRAADERRAWRELLQRFPSSVYAQRARQQLAEADP